MYFAYKIYDQGRRREERRQLIQAIFDELNPEVNIMVQQKLLNKVFLKSTQKKYIEHHSTHSIIYILHNQYDKLFS